VREGFQAAGFGFQLSGFKFRVSFVGEADGIFVATRANVWKMIKLPAELAKHAA
jgi:hypothetical protein